MNHAHFLQIDQSLGQHSYYEASVERPTLLPALDQNLQADVVIVGAGFSGLSAAIELRQAGLSVVVVDAGRVCGGASGRNGGQAIVGYASGMAPFEQQLGRSQAKAAWDMSIEAIALIDQRIATHHIDCDRVKGYLTVADSPRKARALQEEVEQLALHYGLNSQWVQGGEVQQFINSSRYLAAAYEPVSGHLHPLKYGLGLLQLAQSLGVRVFENTVATALHKGQQVVLSTPRGQVKAGFALLAGNCTLHAYAPQLAKAIKPRIMPVGTYMIATEPLPPALCAQLIPNGAAVCDNNFVLDYFRFSADHRLLFGGRVSYSTRTPHRLAERMQQRMAHIFPELAHAKVAHVWGGFVDISLNRSPDFGRLAPNVYYLQGYSGHGVALSGLAGKLVSEAITTQASRFDVFAQLKNRRFPGGDALRTPALVLATRYNLLKDLLP
jgi:gamma-glutamylputrescine oxidase